MLLECPALFHERKKYLEEIIALIVKCVIKQGVRQGGVLSTLHYKLFNNDLLHMLESLGLGAFIGPQALEVMAINH